MKLNRVTISVFDWGCGLLPSPKISAMFSHLFCVQLFIVKTKLIGKNRKSGTSNIKRPPHEMKLKPGNTTREYVVITVRRGAGILERIFLLSLWNKKQFEFERTIAETKWDTDLFRKKYEWSSLSWRLMPSSLRGRHSARTTVKHAREIKHPGKISLWTLRAWLLSRTYQLNHTHQVK